MSDFTPNLLHLIRGIYLSNPFLNVLLRRTFCWAQDQSAMGIEKEALSRQFRIPCKFGGHSDLKSKCDSA